MATIRIDKEFHLCTEAQEGDIERYLVFLNDKELYEQTLRIPSPYTREDALEFISRAIKRTEECGHPMNFRVRNAANEICGSISLFGKYGTSAHKDEIGYWIGKPYRNSGLMTKVLSTFTDYVTNEYGIARLEATIFAHNTASQRVAEKCGYNFEGTLKKAYFKDGKFIDGKLFAFVK